MTDYARMSRSELMARVRALEAQTAEPSRSAAPDHAELPPSTALHESGERLRAILETAVEGIITIDERGIIESLNPAAERTFGFSAAELIGKNVSVLMPSPYREEHDRFLANYCRTGKAKIIGIGREVLGQRKDGSVFPMDLAVSEVRLADRRLFTGFVRDITGRKRLEQEILEISDTERRRIGQDLHDGLCQHLAGIELMSRVLQQKLAPKSRAASSRVGEIGRHVREAISQTRSLARGLSPVTLESEGLVSALHELAGNTERLFGAVCRFVPEGNVQVRDSAIATHIYRIAQEAVSNALKHGKAKEILLRLEPGGDRIVLTINDNGRGLPAVPVKSSGMGLRIMEYRASMIRGRLSIQNRSGGGVSVVCSLPGEPERKKRRAG